MLASRTAIALVPAVAAVGSIAASRRSGASPVLLALPGARVRFGADVDGGTVDVPAAPAVVGSFDVRAVPSIRSPLACRAWLAALWHYIASTRSSGPGWDDLARTRWAYIATAKVQYFGPAGFDAQPGWVDLAERAAKRDAGPGGGIFLEDDARWSDFARYVVGVVIPAWRAEWAAADYGQRVEIGQAWQRVYRDVTVREVRAALPGLPDLSPGWGGFGFALGLALVGAAAFIALRPDVAAGLAGASVARARRAGEAYRAGRRA